MNVFSFIGDQLHLLAIYILLIKVWKLKSVTDISFRSQLLFFLVYVSRYVDVFFVFISTYNTVLKIIFIGTTLLTLVILGTTQESHKQQNDSFRHEILLITCWIMAFFLHYSYSRMEILWTFSIYLESVAIVPQMYLLYRNGAVEKLTGFYLLALGSYRAFYILNWAYRYQFEDYFDVISVSSGIVQTTIYCIFLCIYLVKLRKSGLEMAEKISAFNNIHSCPEAGMVATQSSQCIQPWKSTGKSKDAISEESERAARKLEECLNESNGYYSAVYCKDAVLDANEEAAAKEIDDNEKHLNDVGHVLKGPTNASDAGDAKQ